tara:strand:- start:1429 stop:1944 length:516 start_codon:yes stop_codon:yes gene_type:complete
MRIDEVIVNEFGLDDIKQGYAGAKQGIKNFGNKRLANKQIKQAKPLAKKISNEFIKWKARRFPQADVTVTTGKELATFLKEQYQITNPLAQGLNSIAPLLKGTRTLTPEDLDKVFMAIVYKDMNDTGAGSDSQVKGDANGDGFSDAVQSALAKLDPDMQRQALAYLQTVVK